MNWHELYSLLDKLFDTDACFQHVKAIWETDRWFSRDKFQLTAQYCALTMESAGLSVELLPLKADGKTRYFDWTMPIGWDVDHAVLSYADGEVITDYQTMPCCLTNRSVSTPGVVEAEVIVPDRNDPNTEQYRGKILLINQWVSSWVSFAQDVGAIGIISDITRLFPGIRDTRDALYDECMWMTMSGTATVFGMHLTPPAG